MFTRLFAVAALLVVVPLRPAVAQAGPIVLAGRVTDGATGTPLASATVRYRPNGEGLTNVLTTGPDGRFRITLGIPGTVGVSHNGYATVERAFTASDTAIVIALLPLGSLDTRVQTAQALEGLTVTAVRASAATPIARTTLGRTQLERDYSGQDVPLTLKQAPSVTAYSESGSLLKYPYFRVRGIDQSRVAITMDWHPPILTRRPADLLLRLSRPDEFRAEHAGATGRGHEHLRAGGVRRLREFRYALADGHAERNDDGSRRWLVRHGARTLAANSGALDNRWAFHGRFSGMRSDGYRDGASSAANSAFASAGYFGDRDLLKFTFTTGLERNGQSYTPVPESELRVDPRFNPIAGVGDKYRESFATLSFGTGPFA